MSTPEIIQPRRNTAAGAAANNRVLYMGERGFETDTGRWKTGDGATNWNDLDYDDDPEKIAGSTSTGRAVLTGDAAAGRTALGATTAAAALEQTVEYAVAKLPAGHYTPVGKSDGAITVFDTGETVYTFGGSVGGVVDDEIVHTPTGSPSATYYEVDAGARVRRVTCEVKWAPGALGGLCIALPILPWGPPGGHPSGTTAAQEDAGIHLVLYANGSWHCSRWESSTATETKYAESTNLGEFADSDDGEFHTVDVWIDVEASSMTVQFPDGSFKAFSNAAIAADTSSWVVWEQYNFTGASEVGVVLRNLSFDTESRRRESFAATKVDIAEAMLAINTGYNLEYVTTSAGSKTMTKFSAQIQVPTGSAAHTIVLPTTDVPKGYEVIIVNTSTGVITVNSSSGALVTAISSGTEGRFRAFADTPTTAGNWGATLVATTNTTQTFTAKRIDPRVTSTTSASSLTPSYSTSDLYIYTALAANLTLNAPGGTTNGGRMRFRFKDDGVSRTLTWNAIYRAIGVTLPTATTAGKWMYVDMMYNSADTRWDVTDVKIEA